ncbi:MAG: YggT family protein [Chloroflexi bacterium]|nr:YggT family protein [Chloroflexota bacterium]
MSEIKSNNDEERSVDRREQKVVTQQPGYVASEQVTRDVAAEQRMGVSKVAQVIWILLGLLEILLGLRVVFKLIAANPDAGFATFIYGITKPFIAPFALLVGTPTAGGSVFEFTTLIAMAVYALFVWIIVRLIMVGANRSSARTETRSEHTDTHQQ